MKITISDRLKKLPPYLFLEIDRKKKAALEEGRDIIDLGVGDPDQPTPRYIIDALYEAAQDPSTHRYALDAGLPALKARIAFEYLSERFKQKPGERAAADAQRERRRSLSAQTRRAPGTAVEG